MMITSKSGFTKLLTKINIKRILDVSLIQPQGMRECYVATMKPYIPGIINKRFINKT